MMMGKKSSEEVKKHANPDGEDYSIELEALQKSLEQNDQKEEENFAESEEHRVYARYLLFG